MIRRALAWPVLMLGISMGPVAHGADHVSPLLVPAAAFHEDGTRPEAFFFHPSGYLEGDGTTVVFVAAVYLPNGATVTGLTLAALDNTDSCELRPNVTALLSRVRLSDGVSELMAATATGGAAFSIQRPSDTSIDGAGVNNLHYRYYVYSEVCSVSHRLYGVSIEYTE